MAKKNKKNSIQRLDLNRAGDKKDKGFHNDKSEQAVAAYLGYEDLGEFRKFKFSHFIVSTLQLFNTICQDGNKKADRLDALDFLGSNINNIQAFPSEESAIVALYPLKSIGSGNSPGEGTVRSNYENLNARYACLLYKAHLKIQKAVNENQLASQATEQEKTLSDFESQAERSKMPRFDIETLRMPILGPRTEFNEGILEPYNRISIAVSSLMVSMHPSKWTALTKHEAKIFASKKINPIYIPAFMLVNHGITASGLIEKSSSEQRRSWKLVIDRTPGSRNDVTLNKHFEERMKHVGARFPLPTIAIRDPMGFEEAAEWRDQMRLLLSLHKSGLDFLTLDVEYEKDGNKIIDLVFNPYDDSTVIDWDQFKDRILNSGAKEFVVVYMLVPTPEEEDDYPWEFDGIPTAIQIDFMIGEDQDIALRSEGGIPTPH